MVLLASVGALQRRSHFLEALGGGASLCRKWNFFSMADGERCRLVGGSVGIERMTFNGGCGLRDVFFYVISYKRKSDAHS